MSNISFEYTEKFLETGLRGIPVGYCSTSSVHPYDGLFYKGYSINKLSKYDPEAIIYLFFHNELPTQKELNEFKKNMFHCAPPLDKDIIKQLYHLPQKGHPMKWFLAGINLMGMIEVSGDYKKDFIHLITQLPELVAAIFRIREGWGDPIESRPEMGYIENFIHMLGLPTKHDYLADLMRIFHILHMDHGGGNLSTFTGKVVVSGRADLYEGLMGAMSALAGELHGKANQECLQFIMDTYKYLNDPNDETELKNYIKEKFEAGDKIFGFGHAVLKVEDPRATIQYELGQKIIPNDPYFKLSLSMRKVVSNFLSKQEKISNPYPNVDAVSGTLLYANGLKDPSYYTVLFGLSRCIGIGFQILYERTVAKNKKGTPIIRPKYIYSGPTR